jgi:hypothetical protein
VKARKLSLVAGFALAIGLLQSGPQNAVNYVAHAQNLGDRTVSGTVLGPDAAPVVGATVFLKSQKTKSIRSFTSVALGHFHFAQVNKAEDFDLWAEKDGKKSAVKTVSSWDARSEFISDLHLK